MSEKSCTFNTLKNVDKHFTIRTFVWMHIVIASEQKLIAVVAERHEVRHMRNLFYEQLIAHASEQSLVLVEEPNRIRLIFRIYVGLHSFYVFSWNYHLSERELRKQQKTDFNRRIEHYSTEHHHQHTSKLDIQIDFTYKLL